MSESWPLSESCDCLRTAETDPKLMLEGDTHTQMSKYEREGPGPS